MGRQSVDRQMVVARAYRSAYKDFGLTDAKAAAILGETHTRFTLSQGFSLSSKEHEIQVLFIHLYQSLYAILGGDKAAMKHWFSTSNKHLRGIPMQLVTRITGLAEINAYLDAMRAKV
ncbi:MbcA/ParS/Xre antitoxin family protein [Salinimonas iocasae]|uniref:DUF2384 domain-containing protein n=1 Tax=Salinimonas iocasae TaxID=2572577 RepID=A0A5B7YIL8_9ALTE|nr:MbcA/ParS/Xre antitoxin family protein [Salinimonas iocasae]QCZ95487.1 DUF2384 domain-containing protein [Salinimonas iocasae]